MLTRRCGSGWNRRPTSLALRLARLHEHGQHLQRGDQPVAGGGVVAEDDVAGLLAAEIVAVGAHALDHVAVADGRAHEREAEAAEEALEARGST